MHLLVNGRPWSALRKCSWLIFLKGAGMDGLVRLVPDFFESTLNVDSICRGDHELINLENGKFYYHGTIFDAGYFKKFDTTKVDNLFGHYTYLYVDNAEHRIIAGTDKLGFSPLYFAIEDNCFIYSTSLPRLIEKIKNKSPDYDAWDEIFNLGEILGNKTTIKEIKRLEPGVKIVIHRGKIDFVKYWDFELPDYESPDLYIENNNELLSDALEFTRSCDLDKVILLSGGEDSRRLAVAAHSIGLPASFATQEAVHKGDLDNDVLLAEEIAKNLGRSIIRSKLPTSEEYFTHGRLRDQIFGYESAQHQWLMPLLEKTKPVSLIYDGIVGDITVNGHYYRLFPHLAHKFDKTAFLKKFCPEKLPFVFKRHLLTSSLTERIRAELEKLPDDPRSLALFFIFNHTRRSISLQSVLYSYYGHKTVYPFLYYPLFMQSLSLHPEHHLSNLYHRMCGEKLNKNIFQIPSTRGALDQKYIIPLQKERLARDAYYLRNATRISNQVFDCFESVGMVDKFAFKALPKFLLPFLRPRKWLFQPLSRMTDFHQWLDGECTQG